MISLNIFLFVSFFVGFVSLSYSLIILIKRKEYENKRILKGYNAMLFGIFILALYSLIRSFTFGYLALNSEFIPFQTIYIDIIPSLILLPLFAASFFVGMLMFKEV